MFYINTATNEYPITEGDIRASHPHTSFALPFVPFEPYALVSGALQPQHDILTEKVVEVAPAQTDEGYVQQWQVQALPDDVAAANQATALAQKVAEVRNDRNTLLLRSDWTQLADSAADKAAWANYRQALREVTGQEGFPWTITWPTQPE
jgi:hypothetical protein